MKLWIDDLRPSPERAWNEAVTSDAAIGVLERWRDARDRVHPAPVLEEISFDHDLGGDDTSRRVLTWMIENDVWPQRISFHTMNPVGRKWLTGTAHRYAPTWVQVGN